jgi:signal transduction histidine kinase
VKPPASDTPLHQRLPRVSQSASALAVLIGCLNLFAWTFNLRPLLLVPPNAIAMNPATAVTFILAGIALWRLSRSPGDQPRWKDALTLCLATFVSLLGILKLVEYLFHIDLNIDQLLFAHRVATTGTQPPNEIAPNTALNFVFLGLTFFLLDAESPKGFRPAQALALAVGFIAFLALIGYAYRVLSFYRVGSYIPMDLGSALAFALLSVGAFAARPARGIMMVISSATAGGAMARRLLPIAIIIPCVLGALRLYGEQAGYWQTEFGVSIFVVSTILVFSGVIWWNARLLYSSDLERSFTARRLAAQYKTSRMLSDSGPLTQSLRGILQIVCQTFGWQVGAIWLVDSKTKRIRCAEVWHEPNPDLAAFVEATRHALLERGAGLPGRVWDTGRAVWIADVVDDTNFTRTRLAQAAGLHGAFAFPVHFGEEVCGVMEFLSPKIESPDRALVQMLTTLGTQIGQAVERERAAEQLRQTSDNLARSNTDLQQFASIASHDLFEPLRMVTSYLELLREQYRSKLDERAQEFIHFAIDGARRMQDLINDLLAYSRVDVRRRAFEVVDTDQIVQSALHNLEVAIAEHKATVTHQPLPKIKGDSIQITQVFQNLIGNALKFQGAEPPRIDINAQRQNDEWLFAVHDNGIGIDPANFERIFVIFQRLHTREEYAGTGMGLAICKRIIERHGGRIWVESSPGKGSTFYFTLPALKN